MSGNAVSLTYLAAGGIVTNAEGTLLLVLVRPARDEIRLPKGHVDEGESATAAALREVAEETGYDDLAVIAPLGEQLVVFPWKKYRVKRTERYYLMQLRSRHQSDRPPQDVEQFFPVWVTWEEALASLTFEAEKEWVRRAHAEVLRGAA